MPRVAGYSILQAKVLGNRKPRQRIAESGGEPDYTFDPWQFGHNYQKRTALWGEFNKPAETVRDKPEDMKKFSMLYSKEIYPEFYGIYTRQERRAITPPGFAKAFFDANR